MYIVDREIGGYREICGLVDNRWIEGKVDRQIGVCQLVDMVDTRGWCMA